MKTSRHPSQQGIAHLVLIILLLVIVAGVGFVGWKVMSHKTPAQAAADAVAKAAVQAACTETDKNICKFISSWKQQQYYTVTSKTTSPDGTASTSTYQSTGTTKFHITVSGDTPYESIVIGNDTYTKASDGVWWKKTVKPDDVKQLSQSANPDQKITDDTTTDTKSTTTYKNLGTEACGNLTCYKYQVIDSSSPDDTSYIWFDTKDYQLRRTRDEAKDGTVTDAAYNYDKIAISVPSPVKVLAANQVLVPGQSQPMTLPDSGTATGGGVSNPYGGSDMSSPTGIVTPGGVDDGSSN